MSTIKVMTITATPTPITVLRILLSVEELSCRTGTWFASLSIGFVMGFDVDLLVVLSLCLTVVVVDMVGVGLGVGVGELLGVGAVGEGGRVPGVGGTFMSVRTLICINACIRPSTLEAWHV